MRLRISRSFCVFLMIVLGLSGPLAADDQQVLGHGLLLSNDYLGDGQDRWRTGSVAFSRIWGPEWRGALPNRPGQVLEFRLNLAQVAPSNLQAPAQGDRPYASAISLGLHTHFRMRGVEWALGADAVVTGAQTGLDHVQTAVHDAFGLRPPGQAALSGQIGNAVHPTLVAEAGRTYGFGAHATLRPFVEARAGDETLLRVGAELTFGSVGQEELLVRDPGTGHRYRAVLRPEPGYAFLVGGDVAHVSHSIYLPQGRGLDLSETRNRVRAGLHWQGKKSSVFYGLTWLGEEFSTQPEGQILGSVRLNFQF